MIKLLRSIFRRAPPCTHEAITSRIETINGHLTHVQDVCRDCGRMSPRFEREGEAVKFYASGQADILKESRNAD
jgi:hypothetical protein